MSFIEEIGKNARVASRWLSQSTVDERNKILALFKEELLAHQTSIEEANAIDIDQAKSKGDQSAALIKRLDFSNAKFTSCIEGLDDVIKLADPLGKVLMSTEIMKDQNLYRISTPIGVLAIIYEARPEAGIQIASLAIKSGNSLILKGGSEAINSNRAIYTAINAALTRAREDFGIVGLTGNEIQLVDTRDEVSGLLKLDKYIDLVIPRGSNALVSSVKSQTSIPVLGHADGICAIYVDEEADLEMAVEVAVDAKTNYPAACNAVETILVNEHVAAEFLAKFAAAMEKFENVRYFACPSSLPHLPVELTTPAREGDYDFEYLCHHLAVKVVASVDEAIAHINTHSSGHTDCIITKNDATAETFLLSIQSASVYRNCSTRFADGFRYGFGAEVGISTNRIHARGPVGLDGLVTYKYIMIGNGQTVGKVAKGELAYTHISHSVGENVRIQSVLDDHKQAKKDEGEAETKAKNCCF